MNFHSSRYGYFSLNHFYWCKCVRFTASLQPQCILCHGVWLLLIWVPTAVMLNPRIYLHISGSLGKGEDARQPGHMPSVAPSREKKLVNTATQCGKPPLHATSSSGSKGRLLHRDEVRRKRPSPGVTHPPPPTPQTCCSLRSLIQTRC